MPPEIWQTIIATIGVIISALIGKLPRNTKRPKNDLIDLDRVEFAEFIKNFQVTLHDWAGVEKVVAELCESNNEDRSDGEKVDRFLLLTCINGERESTHATAHREWRESPWTQEYEYLEVRIDSAYNEVLYKAQKDSYFHFVTDQHEGTKLGGWYVTERVKRAIIVMVARLENSKTKQVAYLYYSAATHGEGEFSQETLRQILNVRGEIIRSLASPHWVAI